MKRLVAYTLLTLLAVGFAPAPAHAQLLTSPSNEPEVTQPTKEETPAAKEELKDKEESSDSKKAKKAKKTKPQPERDDKMRTPDAEDIKVLEQKLEKKAAKKAKKDADDASKKAAGDDSKKADGDAADANKKADDLKDAKEKKVTDGSDIDKDGTESGGKVTKKDKVPFGKRMASFTTGAILGYPVAMAKRSVYQTKSGTRDFVGETKNPFLLIPAMVVSAPYGFVGGFLEGAQYSVMNSWRASGEEPFSKESFSLED